MIHRSPGFAVSAMFLVVMSFPTPGAPLQQGDYLPLTKAERGKPFTLKSLGELNSKPPVNRASIGPSGADLQAVAECLIVEGRDKTGKKWLVNPGVRMPGLGGRMYIGDLDKDGTNDLAILVYTGGNGLAPTSHFISVMFDSWGRPNTFEADGYFEPLDDGFADLIDMNRDGKAELISMNYDDGYWITNLYKASNAKWVRITGQFRGRQFPLYTRFTRRPNRRAITPIPGRHPFAPDLSNSTPLHSGRLLSFQWRGADSAGKIELTIRTATGKKTTCRPDPWYSSFAVVVDNESGREIAALGAPAETIKSLLDRIIKEKYRIALYGQRRKNECSPDMLRASHK